MNLYSGIKKSSVTLGLSLLLLCLGQNNARALNLPDVPLSVFSNVEHNVLLTFDDSGSMSSGEMPDSIAGNSGTNRYCSSTYNGIAYNPAVTYTPPPVRTSPGNSLSAPTSLPDSSFTAAPVNGFIAGSATVDLSRPHPGPTFTRSIGYIPVRDAAANVSTLAANTSYGTCGVSTAATGAGVAAFYFVYDLTIAGCNPQTTATINNSDTCYRRVQHNNATYGGAWTTAQQTNFANWYTYYRTRNFAAKSAAGRGFQGLPNNVRVAGQHLNNGTAGTGATIRFTNATSTTAANVLKRFCDDPAGTDSLCRDGTTARTDFFTRLYNSPAANSTPLRAAMQRAGNSFGTGNTGANSPYRDVPGDPVSAANPELSCRKNFHILLTDGYWNNDAATVANTDGTARTLGDGTAYTPISPYSDAWTGTLADHAFDYWARDLRPDLTNNVPHSIATGTGPANLPWDSANLPWDPRNNPARWQHMQTFTIGMGIDGVRNPANYFKYLDPSVTGDWDELLSGAAAWPQPADGNTTGANIDDLWHAAVNSRGEYFSARDPDALVNAFAKIIGQINRDTGSAAGLGASGSTTSGSGTSIFQVAYDTGKWAGRLLSRPVDVNGAPQAAAWEAGTAGLNTQDYNTGRNIFTYNPSNAAGSRGVPFRWSNLSATQQTALNTGPLNTLDGFGSQRLDYLRGASTYEGTAVPPPAPEFRVRTCYNPATVSPSTIAGNIPDSVTCPPNVGKLGDIVDSSPVYVAKPDFGYPDTIEGVGNKYSTFVTAQAGRQPMVYVGANDGMLHGFRASDGREEMAYVPNLVYSNISTNNLSLLTYPYYSHRFYVNAMPTVGDVFIGGAWRTVLIGGLRKGGKGYYALDITNPAGFGESAGNALALVKWEFTDPDLGYSYSQPRIVKMATGQWAAVFGNGYNNTGTGRSMIFIVDIATGNLIRKIDTGTCANAPCGGGTVLIPNGMATPAVVDMNDDYIADYIYAGDLLGNMWRVDVRSPNATDWNLATNVVRLFTATDGAPTPTAQPITTKPSVGFHPSGFGGLMVYFGTGKFLENNDNSASGVQPVQTFYGIYDRGVSGRSAEPTRREALTMTRADLLQQTIDATVDTVGVFSTRNISDNPINWRLDRSSTTTHLGWYVNLPESGEKQVTDSLLREGRIIFTTLSPGTDACNPAGSGWLMELSSKNGGRIDETLDLNGDGTFDGLDNSGRTYGAAGAQVSGSGGLSSPIVLTNPPGAPPPGGSRYSETKLVVTSKGAVITMKESGTPNRPEAWRQPK